MHTSTNIFFDLDHTLWDFEKNSALTFNKILKMHAIPVDIDAFLKVYVPLNLEYWKLYREEKITKERLRYERLATTFTKLNVSFTDDLIYLLAAEYIKYLSSFNHLFPGTKALLNYLQPTYKLHIITNGFKEVQRKKLAKSGILNYFDLIIDSESVGVKKPNPKVFYHALKLAKCVPENAIMIGDNLEADILGALAIDMRAIHVDHEQKESHKFCSIVQNLVEIKKLL